MRVGRVITCECGFDARAADEEGLVAAVRCHAAEAHCMPLSHDEALLLAFHAELAAQPKRSGLPLAHKALQTKLFRRERDGWIAPRRSPVRARLAP